VGVAGEPLALLDLSHGGPDFGGVGGAARGRLGLRCGCGGVPFAPLLAFPVRHPRGGEAGGRVVLVRGAVVVLRAVSWLFPVDVAKVGWDGLLSCPSLCGRNGDQSGVSSR
jgi:hypothetical protein